jgi:hypothetical protein
MPREEIGKQLTGFCQLMDIQPPQAPGELISFITQQYGKLRADVIGRALNYWASSDSQILKPKRLNGHFIAQVMQFYTTSRRSVANAEMVPDRPVEVRVYSDEERDAIFMEAHDVLVEQYEQWFYQRIPDVNIVWPGFRHQYEWLVEKGHIRDGQFSPHDAKARGVAICQRYKDTQNKFIREAQAIRKTYKGEILEYEWDLIGYVALHFDKVLGRG